MNISGFGLIELLKNKQNIIGLEIGCYAGVNADNLLKCLPQLVLHGVDPYVPYCDWNGGHTLGKNDTAEHQAYEKLNKYGNRFILHKLTSDDAVDAFMDESFDFIFIDGLHTYEQVLNDCKNYYKKLKPNGLFSGHDYNVISNVKKAVNEYAVEVNKKIEQTETDVWYWYK